MERRNGANAGTEGQRQDHVDVEIIPCGKEGVWLENDVRIREALDLARLRKYRM